MTKPFKRKRVTIGQVAREAGVSVSTVSRVLNDLGIVTPDKERRVRDAIEKLHYSPNPAARSLSGKGLNTVAVLVPNIVNTCMSAMVQGAFDVFRERDINLVLFDAAENLETERRHIQYILDKGIGGLIYIAGCGPGNDFAALAKQLPLVLVDVHAELPGIDNLVVDDALGIETLYNHLWNQGHRTIGLLAGDPNTGASKQREAAYRACLEARGVPFDRTWVQHSDWSRAGGKQAFARLPHERVTGLICASDFLAIGALNGAWEKNIRVPGDLSILGFDNFTESEFTIPPLTSLSFPNYEMGREAAHLVLSRFNEPGREDVHRTFPMELKRRKSSAPPRD